MLRRSSAVSFLLLTLPCLLNLYSHDLPWPVYDMRAALLLVSIS